MSELGIDQNSYKYWEKNARNDQISNNTLMQVIFKKTI